MNPFAPDDLSDLWAEAQKAERLNPQPRMVNLGTKPERGDRLKTNGRELFQLDEYWEARRGIALIHEESRTLIGNFKEYVHKRVAGCRKLLRTDEPVQIHATEFISGWEHLGEEIKLRCDPQIWTDTREVVHPSLVLSALGVHAEVVMLRVMLSFGGIARVELAEPTRFTSPDARTILTLSAGVNVLECMSLEAKVALRQELSHD